MVYITIFYLIDTHIVYLYMHFTVFYVSLELQRHQERINVACRIFIDMGNPTRGIT